jgi:hypothetical protein
MENNERLSILVGNYDGMTDEGKEELLKIGEKLEEKTVNITKYKVSYETLNKKEGV